MPLYAQVLPNPGRPLSQLFTYSVPENLGDSVVVGAQVLVPFGRRTVIGVVAGILSTTDREDLKDIEAVLEDVPALPEDALPISQWIAEYYLCELGEALRPFLAEGMNYRIGRKLRLSGEPIPKALIENPDSAVLLQHLQNAEREVSMAALRKLVPRERLRKTLRALKARRVVVERATLLPPRSRERQIRLLELAITEREVEQYVRDRRARAPSRVACLLAACESGPATAPEIARRAESSPSTVQALVEDGVLRAHWTPLRRRPWAVTKGQAGRPPDLTANQESAVRKIDHTIEADEHASFLLYGVTASGKTEVFLRCIERALAKGRQAIVLMPEISLTAQAMAIYRARFGDRVAILHSNLSLGERWDEWQRIRTGEAGVVIGARSAVFAPIRNLGLIVVDEEHETSYKQEQAPRYHTREVALKRGELNCCPVILASATPSLEAFYDAELGRHTILRLPARVDDRPLPKVQIVDMRNSSGKRPILSSVLRQALADGLRRGEQAILLLNRRGFATFLLCPSCGESVRCPDCGVALKYHRVDRQIRCHHCGMSANAPEICAKCGSCQMRFSGHGTERVEREIQKLFPRARLGRMDRDTTARKGSHVRIFNRFQGGETDVLIGTQMVAKGFDFRGVTLVGVISADTALNLPDFRAAERTFQLLTQVSGRAGRGEREGVVLVQTYCPDADSIRAAMTHDYDLFYRKEIENRRELSYPPITQIINIVISAEGDDIASERAADVAAALKAAVEDEVTVLGPAPAPLARLRRRYRWHVVVKGKKGATQRVVRGALLSMGRNEPGTLSVDVDPVSLM